MGINSAINYVYQILVAPLHTRFNKLTQGIDFFAFCVVYSVVFILIAWKTYRRKGWIAPARQLLTYRQRIGTFILNFMKKLPVVSGYMQRKLDKQEAVVSKLFDEDMQKSLDPRRANCLPQQGMNPQNLKRRIQQWTKRQGQLTTTQKISGSIYNQDAQFMQQMANFSKNYLYQNPLHLETFKQLLKMESEVIQMTGDIVSPGVKVYGTLTSGGTQSLLLAIHAYKSYYSNRSKLYIVVPNTIHAAFDKGCFYFNIEIRKAKIAPNFQVDLKHLQSLIDSNTIMISGSAPNYPHGIIDPIVQMAKIAKKKNVGMHVDACLGGFVLGFADLLGHKFDWNFKVDGVTSMSIDHHKYGLAPKGVSGLFWKTKQLRGHQIFSYGDWCGGAYATPTMVGSRSGVGSAGAWYALNTITKEGYKSNAKKIIDTTVKLRQDLKKIPGVQVFGDPQICVLAFTTKQISPFKLNSYLSREKKWDLSAIHRPEGIHLSVTLANHKKINEQLVRDIKQGIEAVKSNPLKYKGSTEALYGGTASIPDTSIREGIFKLILKSYLR